VGNIDLLAEHRKVPRWLVVELKRGQTNDDTMGQVLRYMGWVTKEPASPKESVEGLIVARSVDDKLRYAVSVVPSVVPVPSTMETGLCRPTPRSRP